MEQGSSLAVSFLVQVQAPEVLIKYFHDLLAGSFEEFGGSALPIFQLLQAMRIDLSKVHSDEMQIPLEVLGGAG